ncbi:type IV pilin [Haloarcula sp. Atlit-7R]|uniref:type IV pilin n=1 Tax=Haloarcula sp. Atlit-7R TaxID=2282125 RepID=UPI000EF172EA|nr:type IV pilin N-terminal domain-containing protein [Haloarcula sp. Atlit-7R]RLM96217.1 type IV pilin [Haloarcula sp. Atlit-7R]
MDLKQLFQDDDAVSPVIGVILMVAITVILAAVIASFVLGLGDQAQQATPQASFSFEYTEGSTDGEGYVTVTHDGGDSIEAQELYIRGSGIITTNDASSSYIIRGGAGPWDGTNSNHASGSEISAGQKVDVEVSSDYEIRVVYEPVEGDTSATLAQDSGPDA